MELNQGLIRNESTRSNFSKDISSQRNGDMSIRIVN